MNKASKRTITDEQLDAVMKEVEENLSEDEKTLREIKKGNIPEYLKDNTDDSSSLVASPDPDTGEMVLSTVENNDSNGWDTMEKELENVTPAEFTEDGVNAAIKKLGYKDDINQETLIEILALVKKMEQGEKIRCKDLPNMFQSQIAKTIMELGAEKNAPYLSNKELKDQMAAMFIESIADEALSEDFKNTVLNLNSIIKTTVKQELGAATGDLRGQQYTIMLEQLPELASKIRNENPKRADEMIQVSKAYKESFTLQSIYNSYAKGKPKIKPIQIDKFHRHCGEFQRLYNNSKWEIQNIETLLPILCRNFPKYDEKIIKRFIVLFINYAIMKNMSPDNLEDHTFMYYTIYNISSLDLYNDQYDLPDNDIQFYKDFKANIEKIFDLIIERM